jgi:hypothetical protein
MTISIEEVTMISEQLLQKLSDAIKLNEVDL